MAITGTGTQEDPWVVHDLAELRSAASMTAPTGTAGYGGYIVLDEDINCNEQCPTGWTTIRTAHEIDLNYHSILAPVISEGNSLFNNPWNSYYGLIKNGYILNLYTNYTSSGKIFDSANVNNSGYDLENVQLTMVGRGETWEMRVRYTTKCIVEIKGILKCPATLFSMGNAKLIKSRFICNYTSDAIVLGSGTNPGTGSRLIRYGSDSDIPVVDCLFEGSCTNFDINSTNPYAASVYVGRIESTIVDVAENGTNNLMYKTFNHCLISNRCKMLAQGSYKSGMTQDDLKSIDKVTAAGFTVIEVV